MNLVKPLHLRRRRPRREITTPTPLLLANASPPPPKALRPPPPPTIAQRATINPPPTATEIATPAEVSPQATGIDTRGSDRGFTIGGGGGDGNGTGGCNGANLYGLMINSQLQNVFMRNEKTDSRSFQIQARLYFESAGTVQRAELIKSTGDLSLDEKIKGLLGQVDIGRNVPKCLGSVKVWVSEPWTGAFGGASPEGEVTSWRRSSSNR